MIKLIGILGNKRHGKDTVSKIICSSFENIVRLSFADALKKEVADMLAAQYYPISSRSDYDFYQRKEKSIKLLEEMNSNEIDEKTNLPVKERYRLVLQWWGTEFRRQCFSDTYWLEKHAEGVAMLNPKFSVTVPDVRFLNEAEYIGNNKGVLLKVINPRIEQKDVHLSEKELELIIPDYTIINDGTLEDLKMKVLSLFKDKIPGGIQC